MFDAIHTHTRARAQEALASALRTAAATFWPLALLLPAVAVRQTPLFAYCDDHIKKESAMLANKNTLSQLFYFFLFF